MSISDVRRFRPSKTSEEYLEAMREDLAEWLNALYPELKIDAENFMECLDTGVALCKHANNVQKTAEKYLDLCHNNKCLNSIVTGICAIHYFADAKRGTFFARDNVSNFITWCRNSLKILDCLLFETDDLILRKNQKNVILCLFEVARRAANFGMSAPVLVQMERQIDQEIANEITEIKEDKSYQHRSVFDWGIEREAKNEVVPIPQPQVITNDLKNLDEMVRDLVEKCTCPSQFPMVRVSEGKYRIGDTKVLIFVRILRAHVMVRVGGGWDTLSHYLNKHDPCRNKIQRNTTSEKCASPITVCHKSNSNCCSEGICQKSSQENNARTTTKKVKKEKIRTQSITNCHETQKKGGHLSAYRKSFGSDGALHRLCTTESTLEKRKDSKNSCTLSVYSKTADVDTNCLSLMYRKKSMYKSENALTTTSIPKPSAGAVPATLNFRKYCSPTKNNSKNEKSTKKSAINRYSMMSQKNANLKPTAKDLLETRSKHKSDAKVLPTVKSKFTRYSSNLPLKSRGSLKYDNYTPVWVYGRISSSVDICNSEVHQGDSPLSRKCTSSTDVSVNSLQYVPSKSSKIPIIQKWKSQPYLKVSTTSNAKY